MTSVYNQLVADTQAYIKLQYQLLQVKGIQQLSRLLGAMISIVVLVVVGMIALLFLAIALAAWLEQWLPMWASYMVIAGGMLLIAFAMYWGRQWWLVRPIEKLLSHAVMQDCRSLETQKQLLEQQTYREKKLLQRDVDTIKQEWGEVEHLLHAIRSAMP
jgi:hypothetical protein